VTGQLTWPANSSVFFRSNAPPAASFCAASTFCESTDELQAVINERHKNITIKKLFCIEKHSFGTGQPKNKALHL
jgi:hypothetical protein